MPVSISDIAAMSDIELTQFMEQNRAANGNFELPVDDWDKLSNEERSCLAGRLQAQQEALAQSPTALDKPLDLDQLDARLREVAHADNTNNTLLRGRPSNLPKTRPRSPEFVREARAKALETEAYNDLVKDGGRPLYPINLLDRVFRNPDKHNELLRPWLPGWRTRFPWKMYDNFDEPRRIFQRQLVRWEDFRKWQNDNRDINDDADYPTYVEWVKRREKRFAEEFYPQLLADLEADPSCLKKDQGRHQRLRSLQRRDCRESRDGKGFDGYVEAVKQRLTRHGFTRPFQLQKDPKQQDRLTEWIEYLNFEYWWVDWYAASTERLRPAHDKAWQRLLDLKAVKPHETMESVRTPEALTDRQLEQDQASNAVRRALIKGEEVYASTQLDPNRLSIPMPERRRRLQAATREIRAAKASWQSIEDKNNLVVDFIRSTFGFIDVKTDAARHGVLVQWVLDQADLVEAELAQSKATTVKYDENKRGTKRRLDSGNNSPANRSLKQQKPGDGCPIQLAATV
ncbi:hypothetical protein O1611_g8990 [Lasiodiplodia mahajangana]|uniref:Uncharacterized protein n=1 Tax=Lasiodiplodia mahajangana TaxID=1108764 RepID=A0ACC2JB62_9PEZI|nr:hypothetical protein O1611_g8990 [Lasiodiplodia mahajangana]